MLINTSVPRAQLLDPTIGCHAIEARRNRLMDPHIAPLTEWVIARRSDPILPPGAGNTIPWLDPASGGIASRALLLLQDPSRTAATGTGFISPDNNDRTARNTTDACADARLGREHRLHWNVYPWWVNTKKNGVLQDPTRATETWTTATWISAQLWGSLFELLPELRVVVTFGVQTKNGWEAAVRNGLRLPRDVMVIHAPSLSPPGYYSHKTEIIETLSNVARLVR